MVAPVTSYRVPRPFGSSARDTADLLKQAINGKLNNTGQLTLAAGAASTVVPDTRVTAQSHISLTPLTANAAADVGAAGSVYVSARSAGVSFTLTHPNNANADKTFSYSITG